MAIKKIHLRIGRRVVACGNEGSSGSVEFAEFQAFPRTSQCSRCATSYHYEKALSAALQCSPVSVQSGCRA